MNARALLLLAPGSVAAGFAASLLDAGVKGGILLLLAAAATVALRKSSAATRHLIWTAGMVCALTMPMLSLCLPQWRVLPVWLRADPSPASPASLTSLRAAASSPDEMQQSRPVHEEPAAAMSIPPLAHEGRTAPIQSSSVPESGFALSFSDIVLLGWAVGVLLLLFPLLRSAVSLRRLARRSHVVRKGVLAERAREAARELRLRRSLTIHTGSPDAMPMVWGVWRGRLLLPSSAEQWPEERLRAVLLHELAHICRRDPLTLLLAQLARAIHWFNPLAWLAVHRLRIEQERACDDYVLRSGVKPSDYASDVLEIATASRIAPATASMALSMASPVRLENRLRVIVEAASNRTALTGWAVAGAVTAAIAIALPLAMARAADEKPEANTGRFEVAAQPVLIPGVAVPPAATAPVTEPAYLFGKTHEHELWTHWHARYFDLDTGALLDSHPPGDLVWHLGESDLRVRAGLDMAIIAAGSEGWDATADEVHNAIDKAAPQKRVRLGGEESHRNWFYETREGARGVLQIVPNPKSADSVLLRYKQIRPRVLEFARTTTVVLPSIGNKRYLDLQNRQLHASLPKFSATVYLEHVPDIGWCVFIVNSYHYVTGGEQGSALWDSMSAERAGEPTGNDDALVFTGNPLDPKPFYKLHDDTLPVTVFIPQWGLVRITGVDSPDTARPAVILDCKLLKNAPNLVITSPAPSPALGSLTSAVTDKQTGESASADPNQPEHSPALNALGPNLSFEAPVIAGLFGAAPVQPLETAAQQQTAVESAQSGSASAPGIPSAFSPFVERTGTELRIGHFAAALSNAATFGAVIEVPLKKDDMIEEFLDLDTGRRATRAAYMAGPLHDWARAEKIDMILHEGRTLFSWALDVGGRPTGTGKVTIRTFDMLVAAAPSIRWETATAQEILAHRLTQKSPIGALGEEFTSLQPDLDNTDTYIFQTRENSRGILQVTASVKDSGGVKIRYKLVQQPESAAHVRSSPYVFDREYQREMDSIDSRYLDLDSGTFVEGHPPGDLVLTPTESDLRVRAGMELIAVSVQAEKWDSAQPSEVLDALRHAWPQKQVRLGGSESRLESESGRTWFFKTREGGAGVLRITPHREKPGSVKIRYKLVRPRREFEPVTSLLLPSAAESKQFLNLTDGQSYRTKPKHVPVVYLERDPQRGWNLIVEGIYNYPTDPEKGVKLWESMSAEEIAQPAGLAAVPFERKMAHPLRSQGQPSVVLIPQWGLLRIRLDDPTTTTMIEYKRVAAEGHRDAGKRAESEHRGTRTR